MHYFYLYQSIIFFGLIIFASKKLWTDFSGYWRELFFFLIIICGAEFFNGYTIYDEILISAFNVLMLIGLLMKKYALSIKKCNVFSFYVISLFFAFLTFSSVSSFFLNFDYTLVRWIFLFINMLIMTIISFSAELPRNSLDELSFVVVRAGLLYFGFYIANWILINAVYGLKWEDFQTISWAGSSYAMLNSVALLPACIFLLKRSSGARKEDYFAGALIFLITVASVLYSSRIETISIILSVAVILSVNNARKKAFLCLLPVVAIILIYLATGDRNDRFAKVSFEVESYGTMLAESVQMPFNPRASDVDRNEHLKIAFKFLSESEFQQKIFGVGTNGHRVVLGQYLKGKGESHANDLTIKNNVHLSVRSTTFSAFLIDYGLFGMLLLAAVFFVLIKKLAENSQTHIFIPFVFLLIVWTFITDFRELVFLYFLLIFTATFKVDESLPMTGRA